MNARWWLVLERAQAALPVLGAAALAGFTWWLVQSSPREGGASGAKPAASAPDYELHRARIVRVEAVVFVESRIGGKFAFQIHATNAAGGGDGHPAGAVWQLRGPSLGPRLADQPARPWPSLGRTGALRPRPGGLR